MKILTPEEERAHNRITFEGGAIGGLAGLAVSSLGVWGATRRFHAFRQLSVPFRVFLVTSGTTFCSVIAADRASRTFEKARHEDSAYVNKSESLISQAAAQKTSTERFKTWVSEQRYPIVFGSWVASMGAAFGLVSRNRYLTGQQKLVQARVYAQGLTLAVLIASFALEGNDLRAGKGRWETVKVVDPEDPEGKRLVEKRIHHESYSGEDQWMDMIESQERKMKAKGEKIRGSSEKNGKGKKKGGENGNGHDEGANSKDDKEASSSKGGEDHGQEQDQQQQQQKQQQTKKKGKTEEHGAKQ